MVIATIGEDKGRERDGHDVDELRLKEHQGPVHEDAALVSAGQNPDEEGLKGEGSTFGEVVVELQVQHGHVWLHTLVQHQQEHWKHGVDGHVAHHEEPLVQGDRHEVADRGEHGLHGGDDEAP